MLRFVTTLLLLYSIIISPVIAAESTSPSRADLKKSSLLPDNPFYFLKPLTESISLAFTFDAGAKEEKRLDIAEERLAETTSLLEKKKYDLAAINFKRYESSLSELARNISKLQAAGSKIEELAKKAEFYAAKHNLVLERLSNQKPSDELINNLTSALKTSQKVMDKSSDILGNAPLTPELREHLSLLEQKGILSFSEATSILSLRSREEVRKRLEGLVSQEILPEVYIKKLDQAQKKLFPADFAKISELKRSEEIIKLEQEKYDEITQKKVSEFTSISKSAEPIPPNIKKPLIVLQKREDLQPKTPPSSPLALSPEVTRSPPPTNPSLPQPTTTSSPSSPQFGSQCNFAPHALGTMFADGKCYFLKCESGWYNNDLDVNNGCESQTDASVSPSPGTSAAGICGSGQVKNEKGDCVPENQTCTDTNGGNNAVPFYTSGTCTDSTGTYTSYCAGSVSKDYFCQGTWDPATYSSKNHRCVSESFDCAIASTAEPYVCSEGACVKASPRPSR